MRQRKIRNSFRFLTLPAGFFVLFGFMQLQSLGQISLRMQGQVNCESDTYQVMLEMKNDGAASIELGNGSLRVTFNDEVLGYQSYESLSFDTQTECGSGISSDWYEHNVDAYSLSGRIGINFSRNPSTQNPCTELAPQQWITVGSILFSIKQSEEDPELSFNITDSRGIVTSSFNLVQPNNGTQKVAIQSATGLTPESLACEPASIKGKLTLQGRSDHAILLSAWLYRAEDLFRPQYVFSPLTNADGSFTLNNITPGTYYVYLKYSNTLSRVEQVTLEPGDNTLEFPALRGGDSNGDNQVNLNDFSLLLGAYNTDADQPDFNSMADFDFSQRINIIDFTILLSNYNQAGESILEQDPTKRLANGPSYPIQKETLLQVVPQKAFTHYEIGDTISLDLWVDPLNLSVDGVETHFSYDPNVLKLLDSQLGGELEIPFLASGSQAEGRVSLAAGTFQGGKLAPFKFGTVHFMAIGQGDPNLDLFEPKIHQTAITHLGYSILYQVEIPALTIHSPKPLNYLQAFPNPSKGTFQLERPADVGEGTLTIFDLQGRRLQTHYWCSSCGLSREVTLSLSGTYLVKLQSEEKVYSAILQVQ